MGALLSKCNDSDIMIFDKSLTASFNSDAVENKTNRDEVTDALTVAHDRGFPGYVRLMSAANGRMEEIDHEFLISRLSKDDADWSYLKRNRSIFFWKIAHEICAGQHSFDLVPCIICPNWPAEASVFFTRARPSGWPSEDRLKSLYKGGFHVVPIAHPFCRDSKKQWRLSFSKAKLFLVRSWSKRQKVVYHILKIVSKNIFDKFRGKSVLKTYHFKTLMFWACEKYLECWWEADGGIIRCCNELLETIVQWFKNRCCPNYFLPSNNMFKNISGSGENLWLTLSCLLDVCDIERLCKLVINDETQLGNMCNSFCELNSMQTRIKLDSRTDEMLSKYFISLRNVEEINQLRNHIYASVITAAHLAFSLLPGLHLLDKTDYSNALNSLQKFSLRVYIKLWFEKEKPVPSYRVCKKRIASVGIALFFYGYKCKTKPNNFVQIYELC